MIPPVCDVLQRQAHRDREQPRGEQQRGTELILTGKRLLFGMRKTFWK